MSDMRDQADTLRRLMQEHLGSELDDADAESGPRVMTVASGKGGVGKSSLVANLGALMARSGKRVLLVDGDFGLANLDIIFGVQAQVSVEDVLSGRATPQDAVVGLEPNLWLLPASSGLLGAKKWDATSRSRLSALFAACPWDMDLILLDLGAGIGENVVSLHHNAYESVVVLTPEPTSFADAYGLIKTLRRERGVNRLNIIVNQVVDGREGVLIFQKLKDVTAKFMDCELRYIGHCARDEKFLHSVMKRKILLDLDRGAPAVPCLELLAKRIRLDMLGDGDVIAGNVVRAAERVVTPLLSGRFQDEPARLAPGMTAKFWRTLLGEVKA